MELLETQDPHKRKLIEKSERHRQALEKEVKAVSERTERVLKNVLIIGGSLALAYFITSQFYGSRKKKKLKVAKAAPGNLTPRVIEQEDTQPSLLARVGGQFVNQATFLLLQVAKDKLVEYLAERKKKDENS